MITVYGIKQCDTCRKALKWLDETGTEHQFHDLRSDGLDVAMLRRWFDSPFRDALVNRRSTTWRALTEAEKALVGEELVTLILAHPTLVKRPVFEQDGKVVAIGFRPAAPPALT